MSDASEVIFLYGADMDPEAVRMTLPDGRFVARAWVAGATLPGPTPARTEAGEVWGILIEVPRADDATTSQAGEVAVTTDAGRTLTAVPGTSEVALAEPAATIAAARYWELPPAYVAALAATAAAL